jgi:hypothetical protein
MLAISRRRDLLTGLFSIAAMVPAINSIVGGAGVALLAAKLLGAAQGLLAAGLGCRWPTSRTATRSSSPPTLARDPGCHGPIEARARLS